MDGITPLDGMQLIQHAASLPPTAPAPCIEIGHAARVVGGGEFTWADWDCDGDADVNDGLRVLAHLSGAPTSVAGCAIIGAGIGDVVSAP
jgi:hypothetical protein